jgi:hypothetical protein
MKAPPLLLGGRSPVVAYLRHSMMVYQRVSRVVRDQLVGDTHRLSRAIVADD